MKLGEKENTRKKIARLKGTLQSMEWVLTVEPPNTQPEDDVRSIRQLAWQAKQQAQDIITYMRVLERRRKKENEKA